MKIVDGAENEDTDPILTNMEGDELQELIDIHNNADPCYPDAEIPKYDEFKEEAYGEYVTMQVILTTDNEYGKAR